MKVAGIQLSSTEPLVLPATALRFVACFLLRVSACVVVSAHYVRE